MFMLMVMLKLSPSRRAGGTRPADLQPCHAFLHLSVCLVPVLWCPSFTVWLASCHLDVGSTYRDVFKHHTHALHPRPPRPRRRRSQCISSVAVLPSKLDLPPPDVVILVRIMQVLGCAAAIQRCPMPPCNSRNHNSVAHPVRAHNADARRPLLAGRKVYMQRGNHVRLCSSVDLGRSPRFQTPQAHQCRRRSSTTGTSKSASRPLNRLIGGTQERGQKWWA